MELNMVEVKRLVSAALAEDIGTGDVTSNAIVPEKAQASAFLVSRGDGVLAGLPVAQEVFAQLSPHCRFTPLATEGARLTRGAQIARVEGPARALLAGERVALNFLQRLSGVATLTRRCVQTVRGRDVAILDTRKTTPLLRHLEKYAVTVGGGRNHRIGLYDQVLIKDNHLQMLLPQAGGLPEAVALAVRLAREKAAKGMFVEVETENLPMVEAAIAAKADIILLDNMTPDQMTLAARMVREARTRAGGRFPVSEASGGITMENLAQVAATGVDAISLGALTHSAPALDIAMDFE